MNNTIPTFYSEDHQDEILERFVFGGFKHGIFVDVGAFDGIKHSNTLFFERRRGWIGINIEPNPTVFKRLETNRPYSVNVQCAVCEINGEEEFTVNKGHAEITSGITRFYENRYVQHENNYAYYTISVATKRMDTLFREYELNRIHYLSIDAEGAEFEIVYSINFDLVFIDVISFEDNGTNLTNKIGEHLISNGYRQISNVTNQLDIFMIHTSSPFYIRMMQEANIPIEPVDESQLENIFIENTETSEEEKVYL
jgi:FkbM family methyltransferase